eukprot:TRINITY_DN26784_c0_g1_i1.p1 TRINITY_DN26784_c0_g1~~TRINITY_DN26784_c0_g1_i1.p1  ORF type:complete len:473 (+),score=77.36 TRINITY_DN26784_c0_g1_i1:56-1474(+)
MSSSAKLSDMDFCIQQLQQQGSNAPLYFAKLRKWAAEGFVAPGGRTLTPAIVARAIETFEDGQPLAQAVPNSREAPTASSSKRQREHAEGGPRPKHTNRNDQGGSASTQAESSSRKAPAANTERRQERVGGVKQRKHVKKNDKGEDVSTRATPNSTESPAMSTDGQQERAKESAQRKHAKQNKKEGNASTHVSPSGRETTTASTTKRQQERTKGDSQRKHAKKNGQGNNVSSNTKGCAICCSDMPLSDFSIAITSACKHERCVCKSCVARSIDLEVNGKGNSTRVLCPQDQCSAVLEYSDVQREATATVFDRFDQLLLRQMLQAEPGFRWCAHASCGNGQIVEDYNVASAGHNTFMRCCECQRRTCVYHKAVWHDEQTCKQYDSAARNSEEVRLLQYFQRENVKRCPACGHAIEKKEGCDHMTCQKIAGGCGHEFCFRCLADYNGSRGIRARGNSAHQRSCPWYFPDPHEAE